LRVCLRLPAYSASAKVICFIIEKLGDWCPGILPNQEVFFRISPAAPQRPWQAPFSPRFNGHDPNSSRA
ncbi:hypothetical protein E2P84_42610, partial [Burkholderia cepacia]